MTAQLIAKLTPESDDVSVTVEIQAPNGHVAAEMHDVLDEATGMHLARTDRGDD